MNDEAKHTPDDPSHTDWYTNPELGLKRKPRVGERYSYYSGRETQVFTITRVEDDLAHFTKENGEQSLIIWRFHDGLNRCLTLIQKPKGTNHDNQQ